MKLPVSLIVSDLFNDSTVKYSTSEIIATIGKMTPRTGATGSLHYSESDESGKEIRMPVSMKEVRAGKVETLVGDTGF